MKKETKINDPVCVMDLSDEEELAEFFYQGKKVYFCSAYC